MSEYLEMDRFGKKSVGMQVTTNPPYVVIKRDPKERFLLSESRRLSERVTRLEADKVTLMNCPVPEVSSGWEKRMWMSLSGLLLFLLVVAIGVIIYLMYFGY